MSATSDKVKIVVPFLTKHMPTAHERLTVLAHVIAADLQLDKATPDEVTQYLLQITLMLDGHFDRARTK